MARILYCYEIFIIYPDISLVHLKKKKLRYYLNFLRGSMKVNTQVLCSQLLLIL